MNEYQWFIVIAGLLMVCVMMIIFWIISLTRRNAGWVDLGWVTGLVLLAVFFAICGQGYFFRRALIALLVMLWGMRLGGMLLKRLLNEGEDRRYQKIRAAMGPQADLKFFFFFQFQALLDVVLAIPFFILCFNPNAVLTPVEWVGVGIWMIGFIGEAIADDQLKKFKEDRLNKGKVCESGLWNYSRHPNYFFEWLIWVGYFLMALGHSSGWLAAIAPVLMLYFLLKVSGVPLAEEQSLFSRGDAFREYQKTTSVFIPLPKRRF